MTDLTVFNPAGHDFACLYQSIVLSPQNYEFLADLSYILHDSNHRMCDFITKFALPKSITYHLFLWTLKN